MFVKNNAIKKIPSAQLGGKRKFKSIKKNGHKDNCGCPICINMKYAKKGGSGLIDFDAENEINNMNDNLDIDNQYNLNNDGENYDLIEDVEYGNKKRVSKKKGGDVESISDIDTSSLLDDNIVVANDADYEELEKLGGSRKKHKSLKGCKTKHRKYSKKHKTQKKCKKTYKKRWK